MGDEFVCIATAFVGIKTSCGKLENKEYLHLVRFFSPVDNILDVYTIPPSSEKGPLSMWERTEATEVCLQHCSPMRDNKHGWAGFSTTLFPKRDKHRWSLFRLLQVMYFTINSRLIAELVCYTQSYTSLLNHFHSLLINFSWNVLNVKKSICTHWNHLTKYHFKNTK